MTKDVLAGAEFAAARKVSGLSQHEMGKRMGITQRRVSQFERDPGCINLKNLSAAYSCVNPQGKAILEKMVNDFLLA